MKFLKALGKIIWWPIKTVIKLVWKLIKWILMTPFRWIFSLLLIVGAIVLLIVFL